MHKMKFRTKVRKVLVHLVLSIKARIYSGCLHHSCHSSVSISSVAQLHLLAHLIYIYFYFDATLHLFCIILDLRTLVFKWNTLVFKLY